MEKNQILKELNSIFCEVLNASELVVNEEQSAGDIDGWDSITHMLLITNIEQHFGVKFKLREVNSIGSIGDIISLLDSKLNNAV